MDHERWVLRVSGRVQGVGYRDRVRRVAIRLGVGGEVWNEADGTVTVVAEGVPERLEELTAVVGRPSGASDPESVERLSRVPIDRPRPGFEIRA